MRSKEYCVQLAKIFDLTTDEMITVCKTIDENMQELLKTNDVVFTPFAVFGKDGTILPPHRK